MIRVPHQVYEDHHKNIWLATDNGLIQLPDGQWHAPRISSFFPGLVISCVYEETPSTPNLSPVYWFATHGAGFKRWQGKTITSYTLDNGLTSDFIYQFFLTPSRHFWLMSKSGLLRLDKTELENYATRMTQQVHCITFDNTEGMLSIEFNNELSPSSALALRNHELWWVTKLGIAMIQPQKVTIHKQAPAAIIERVLYNGKPVNQPLATLPFNSEIELRFYFTAPSFLAPQKIPFLYQLAPVDKSPVLLPAGQERVVSYSHLKPGKYCFRITAANANGFWNSHYATFRFDIKARFEQTFMFKAAIAGLSIIVMVFLYLLFRRKSLKKEEKYKNSSLNPQFVEECIKKLNRIMEIEKLYLDVDISLSILAEKISVSPHILSQILNEQMNRKFSDYINMYRIEEVKRILATHRGAQQKIAAIALDVGFNTTVAFYSAFKKYTGQTPIQYKKQLVSANKHSMPTDSLDL